MTHIIRILATLVVAFACSLSAGSPAEAAPGAWSTFRDAIFEQNHITESNARRLAPGADIVLPDGRVHALKQGETIWALWKEPPARAQASVPAQPHAGTPTAPPPVHAGKWRNRLLGAAVLLLILVLFIMHRLYEQERRIQNQEITHLRTENENLQAANRLLRYQQGERDQLADERTQADRAQIEELTAAANRLLAHTKKLQAANRMLSERLLEQPVALGTVPLPTLGKRLQIFFEPAVRRDARKEDRGIEMTVVRHERDTVDGVDVLAVYARLPWHTSGRDAIVVAHVSFATGEIAFTKRGILRQMHSSAAAQAWQKEHGLEWTRPAAMDNKAWLAGMGITIVDPNASRPPLSVAVSAS
jgi:hypothetical protein